MTQNRILFFAAGAVVLAAAGGYGAARLTGPKVEAPASVEAPATADGLVLDAAHITAAGIVLETVSAGSPSGEILASAQVVSTPDGQAVLTAHAPGAVTRILKRLGDSVRAGETVAVVESRDAANIAAAQGTAQARATLAQKRLERERGLFDQRVSPRQDLEQAEAEAAAANAEARGAQAAASAARVARDGRSVLVTSPINGRLTGANASLGSFVQAETELFRVADPSRIQIEAAVSAADARRLAAGGRATVQLSDGSSIPASIRSVTPALDAQTRAATVVLNLASGAVTPGQSVQVRLQAGSAPQTGVSVPQEAIQRVDGRDVVFVRTTSGFKPQAVSLGERGAGRVAITSGLSAGQSIATRNAFMLKAELGKNEGGED
jgi:cobalt-zinc-cadmium efflux system membrane fusion protein